MRLLLDPGGTRLKFAAVEGGKVQGVGHIKWTELDGTSILPFNSFGTVEGMVFSSFHRLLRPHPPAAPTDWPDQFSHLFAPRLDEGDPVDPFSQCGFEVRYTHGRPGSDRLAAAVACRHRDPDGSFIIIDAGTCITVDLLTPGIWHGGAILPGLSLQSSSMLRAGLPEIAPAPDGKWMNLSAAEGALGHDTDAALRAGIPWATRQSVGAIARNYMEKAPQSKVVLTGGDASHFDGLEGWRTFAHPNLVLEGGALLLNERDI